MTARAREFRAFVQEQRAALDGAMFDALQAEVRRVGLACVAGGVSRLRRR